MQNYNDENNNKVKTFEKNNNYQSSTQSSRETDFIKKNPVIFIIIEWGAIIFANWYSVGAIVGSIFSVAAIVGGYNYTKINKVHGWIMAIAALITLIVQF